MKKITFSFLTAKKRNRKSSQLISNIFNGSKANNLCSEASKALGIGAASFWRRSGSGGDKRYSGKPDGRAVSGAGTPR